MMKLKPRNDFVLVRARKAGLIRGLARPDISEDAEHYLVEATGSKVEGLSVGDRVLMTGTRQQGHWSFVPGFKDLILIRQDNVVLVFDGEGDYEYEEPARERISEK